ncbi:MAG: DUF547 domain-containing protein [Verrucomicrobia bacterium]|nr:MAG: DUF547 domain-containing protein [Verrucomicrobiota bacterium]
MTVAWAVSGWTLTLGAASFDHTHRLWDEVLQAHVHDGLVAYARLLEHRTPLDRYLEQTAAVTETQFETWTRPRQLAFLINLYNAGTVRLILDHYPVGSIKDLGRWFRSPWELPVIRLWGKNRTLDELEHKIIRPRYHEPLVHFALVCAARGCPPLRSEAYVAERLKAQLEDQVRRFLAQTAKNRVEPAARTLYLSPIFKWYREDFEKAAGSVTAFLRPYWPPEVAATIDDRFRLRYTDYDWSLNDAAPGQ